MLREGAFRKKVDEFLKTIPKSHWFSIQQAALRGAPDKMGTINGLFVALELKASDKAPKSELQKYNINRLVACGAFARFVYPENWETIKIELMSMASDRNLIETLKTRTNRETCS